MIADLYGVEPRRSHLDLEVAVLLNLYAVGADDLLARGRVLAGLYMIHVHEAISKPCESCGLAPSDAVITLHGIEIEHDCARARLRAFRSAAHAWLAGGGR